MGSDSLSPSENPLAHGNLAQEYRRNAILGASPVQLVVMLYDGALRFIEQGRVGMRSQNLEMQNIALQKAQRVVSELLATLDFEQGGEIAKNLSSLYNFVLDRLMDANVNDAERSLDEAVATLTQLREAWVQIAATTTGANVSREVALAA